MPILNPDPIRLLRFCEGIAVWCETTLRQGRETLYPLGDLAFGQKTVLSPSQVSSAWISTVLSQPPRASSWSTIQSTPWTRMPWLLAVLRSRASPVSKMPECTTVVTRQKQSWAERAGVCLQREGMCDFARR